MTQIALWGRSHPRELGDIVDFGRHRLTAAAQAFKAQALAAVGIANQAVTDTESFYVGRTPRRMVATDLVRARVDGTLPEFESDWCRIIELKTAGMVT